MQHKIYWGPLKKPIEWSLKTVLAPWAYIASVMYHDTFWYPMHADRMMKDVLSSEWGRLFQNWATASTKADADGYPDVGAAPAEISRLGARAFAQSFKILGTCVREAPEFANKKRRVAMPPQR
jgi:hypothetical protein